MIYERISKGRFASDMQKHGFSYEGACALFDYLEDFSDYVERPVEFDPIAFRCEFTEYSSREEAEKDFGGEVDVVAEGNGYVIVNY